MSAHIVASSAGSTPSTAPSAPPGSAAVARPRRRRGEAHATPGRGDKTKNTPLRAHAARAGMAARTRGFAAVPTRLEQAVGLGTRAPAPTRPDDAAPAVTLSRASVRGAGLRCWLRGTLALSLAAVWYGARPAMGGHSNWPPPPAAPQPRSIRVNIAYNGADDLRPLYTSVDYLRDQEPLSGVLATWKTVTEDVQPCSERTRKGDRCLFGFALDELAPAKHFFAASQINAIKTELLADAWKWLPDAVTAPGTIRLHEATLSLSRVTLFAGYDGAERKVLFDCAKISKKCAFQLADGSLRKLFAKAAKATRNGGALYDFVTINQCNDEHEVGLKLSVSRSEGSPGQKRRTRSNHEIGPAYHAARGCTWTVPLHVVRDAMLEDEQNSPITLPYFHLFTWPSANNPFPPA